MGPAMATTTCMQTKPNFYGEHKKFQIYPPSPVVSVYQICSTILNIYRYTPQIYTYKHIKNTKILSLCVLY